MIKKQKKTINEAYIRELFSNNLSNRLKDLRMSQRELAQLMQISDVQVSRWCNGSAPHWATLAELCNQLGVDPVYFLMEEDKIMSIDRAIESLKSLKHEIS